MLLKKLLIIIIASLALVSSLYARGVTENVAREGVKGVYTYLEDLGKAENDERIPESKREEVVKKVYSGMPFEEAAGDYIKKEESVSMPSSGPALPAKTVESAPVRTETAAPVKAEEAAPVTAPQTEEEKTPVQNEEKHVEKPQIEEKQPEKKTEETLAATEPVIETVVQVADAVEAVVDTAKALVEGFDLVVEEDGTIRATFNYRDYAYASVVVEEDMATITYPAQYIASSDIDEFMAEAVAEFPELLENVYYDVPEAGTLVIYFPGDYVGGTYYRLSVLDELDEEVTAYIDALVAALEAETEEETVVVAEGPVYAETLTYMGVTSAITVNTTYTTFTIPAGMDAGDIEAVAELVAYLYPIEASLLTYSVDGDTLTLTYPEQTPEFLLSALSVLSGRAMALIDDIAASGETAMAEAPAEEKGAVYEDTLYYKNVTSKVAVYNTYAVLTLPEGVTSADVKAVADMISAEYKDAAFVTYTLEGNTLTLSYPEQSDAFLLGAVEVLRAEAVAYIDSLEKTVVKAEDAVEIPAVTAERAASPAETTSSQETAAPVESSSPSTESVKAASSTVATPSAVVEEKKGRVFTYDITMSLKGKFVYYKGSDHIYPTLSFSMRNTFNNIFYLEAGVDVFAYINSDKLYAVSGVNLNAGFNVPVSSFDFYFYAGFRHQLASSTSSFKSGLSVTLGTGIDWRISEHVIVGAGYEYYASSSMFTFYAKYRF